METSPQQVTQLLVEWGNGDQEALEQLTPLVYGELRRLASRYLRKERSDHTLQPTALVHEAYIRLVDHARGRHAAKRGAMAPKLSLDEAIALPDRKEFDLVALDDALNSLAKI